MKEKGQFQYKKVPIIELSRQCPDCHDHHAQNRHVLSSSGFFYIKNAPIFELYYFYPKIMRERAILIQKCPDYFSFRCSN
jgi:hypothetical protein